MTVQHDLPNVLAGPILRHCDQHQFTAWLVTSASTKLTLKLLDDSANILFDQVLGTGQVQEIQVGTKAFIQLINVQLPNDIPTNQKISYDIGYKSEEAHRSIVELVSDICFDGELLPSFELRPTISQMLHGSCRKPHFDGEDGLLRVDKQLAEAVKNNQPRPSMLMMSGDQVYADDVAGPMLVAIHQTIDKLGLFDESWQGAVVNDSQGLFSSELCYYQREQLLPHNSVNKDVYDKIFAASKKPIFTSVNAKNHLVTFAEVIAMYILIWSPEMWCHIDLEEHNVNELFDEQYQKEKKVIEHFVEGLADVRRALANIPVYMIFDDHDVTDDWNLTRAWEEAAYGHPFSKRILGNALAGYWLCQGWGNAPEKFEQLQTFSKEVFTSKGIKKLDILLDRLFEWDSWHYTLATTPKVVVLDTRTHRWRSESNAGKPSGLMDWEAMSEMQQELIGQDKVILVSAAPIYGVKLIEAIQRVFTFFGQPLMVDAENWMAHKGTANVMLNIFSHPKTPPNFIILSGDVHYSFVYEVTHRFRRCSAKIVQVTCSGIKNEFPDGLIRWLDKLNSKLYGAYSPLNWFTKRRRMKVKVRKPSDHDGTLFNGSGIGLITMRDDDEVVDAQILTAKGDCVTFDNNESNR